MASKVKNDTEQWLAVIYSEGEKISSKVFKDLSEKDARDKAADWAHSEWGEKVDWSFHHVVK
jgi:hypothetical protein